mgnify:CR=1 FL=1
MAILPGGGDLRMAVLVRDEKSLSALEMALLLPLFVLIIMGGFEIWKLMMLKRALYIGTYQAARLLASYGPLSEADRYRYAEQFTMSELQGTGLYSSQMSLENIRAFYTDADPRTSGVQTCAEAGLHCGWQPVRVEAELVVLVQIPFFERRGRGLFPLRLKGTCDHNPCRECE